MSDENGLHFTAKLEPSTLPPEIIERVKAGESVLLSDHTIELMPDGSGKLH